MDTLLSWTIPSIYKYHEEKEKKKVVDRTAKEALDKEPTDDLKSFSDLKPLPAKYIHQVWQKEWNEAVLESNKLHEILPKLSRTNFYHFVRQAKKTQLKTDYILVIFI